MRRWRATAGPLLLVLFAACGPQGPMGVVPGGPLAGEVVTAPVDDWSFTDAFVTLAIETRGRWIDHSVTVIATASGRHLYIPSRNPTHKRWVANALRDPHVRIGVDGRIYPAVAKRVTSVEEAEPVVRAQLRKYFGLEAETVTPLLGPPEPGDDRAEVWLFRLTSPGLDP